MHKHADEAARPGAAPARPAAHYSRAYLHHLTKTDETLGWQLLGQHNLHFYHRLMREIRQSILDDTFASLYAREARQLRGARPRQPELAAPGARRPGPQALGEYEVHMAREGFASIRHVASGEIMHARTPPMDGGARASTSSSPQLAERLRLGPAENASDAPPLVLWDVGLGAGGQRDGGHSLLRAGGRPRIPSAACDIVSFENDLDSLRLAFAHRHHFPYLRHGAPAGLLGSGRWHSSTGAGLSWRLVEGDFFETLGEVVPRPDLVFYDLFSGQDARGGLDARRPSGVSSRPSGRATRSCSPTPRPPRRGWPCWGRASTWRRAAPPTTSPRAPSRSRLAALDQGKARRHELLGADWLVRWERSGARYPSDLPEADRGAFERTILRHEQFRGLRPGVEPATQDLMALRGLVGPVDRARSQEELDEAIRRGAAGEEP